MGGVGLIRRFALAATVCLAAFGMLGVQPASAHDVGHALNVYDIQTVSNSPFYYCAARDNMLQEDSQGSGLIELTADTASLSAAFCANLQTAFYVAVTGQLVYWVSGTATSCQSQLSNNGNWIAGAGLGDALTAGCGSGTYSVSTAHTVWVLQNPQGNFYSTGFHNF